MSRLILLFLPILLGIYNIFNSLNTPTQFTHVATCYSLPVDLNFVPLPLEYQVIGTNIEFPSADGKPAKGYLIKAKRNLINGCLSSMIGMA